jgi:HD-like signal output (HDOD) protein
MMDQRILNFILRMPGFSPTVTKVFEICNRPETSSHDLNRVISLDPVLTGRVMKLVNSAYYSLGTEVTSLIHAIILLGLNTVKNLALSTAVLEGMGGLDSFSRLSMDDFWVHSLGVGVISRSFARQMRVPITEQEEYFVAGLLHDLGKVPLNHCYPEKYDKALEAATVRQMSLYEAEKTHFGIDHCTVGGMIAKKWRLHRNFSDVFYYHHGCEDGGSDNRRFIMIISLANLYANHWNIGAAGDSVPQAMLMKRLEESVNIDPVQIAAIHDRVLEDIDSAKIFLQVAADG